LIVEEFKEFLDAENQLIMGLTINATDCFDANGNPIYREDGKVLKGPNYQPPNLRDLI